MTLGEVLDDLTSYEKDVEEDTFNTFRLFAKVHGIEKAPRELDRWLRSLLRRCLDEMPHMDKKVLVAHCRLTEYWFTKVGAGGDRDKPKVYAGRLFQALPQNVQINLAAERWKQISDNLGAIIPELIEEPRQNGVSSPAIQDADANLDRSDA